MDDDGGTKFAKYNVRRDYDNPQFSVGMIFGTKIELKDAIREHAIRGGYDIHFTKSEERKVQTNCKGCIWKIYASFMTNADTL